MNDLPPQVEKKKSNKWLWGCGIGCLGIIILGILAVAGATWFGFSFINNVEKEFQALGMKSNSGQILVIDDTVSEPSYYKAQIAILKSGSNADLGLLTQMAELRGTYNEKVIFRGQILTIHKDAVLKKGLDAKCQIIEKVGTIEGEITGYNQIITETSSVDYSQFERL